LNFANKHSPWFMIYLNASDRGEHRGGWIFYYRWRWQFWWRCLRFPIQSHRKRWRAPVSFSLCSVWSRGRTLLVSFCMVVGSGWQIASPQTLVDNRENFEIFLTDLLLNLEELCLYCQRLLIMMSQLALFFLLSALKIFLLTRCSDVLQCFSLIFWVAAALAFRLTDFDSASADVVWMLNRL